MFDRFRQEKTGLARPHGGLGLGLAIVRHLVELHGGTVRAESAGDGQGVSFTVTLPAAADRKEAIVADSHMADSVAALAGTPEMPTLDGIRVLIVDDDAGSREMAKVALEHCGAGVVLAASAAEAEDVLARTAFDVLLVDIAMPVEDGYTFVRRMRTEGLRTPVGALTAHVHETDRGRALESGFDVHIQKPVEPRALATTVAALAGTSRRVLTR
jgi:CheY-like chemotaxis protein